MKVTTQPQETTQISSAVAIQTRYGMCLSLMNYSNKGVIVTVLDLSGRETHRFLIEDLGADICVRDMVSDRTLTLEVTA